MNSLIICSTLYKHILREEFIGTVHSVFNNSFNVLDHKDSLITFLNSNKTMGPNSILIDGDIGFLNSKIVPNLEIQFYKEFALIKNLSMKINYNKAQLWDKNPILNYNRASKEDLILKLKILEKFLMGNGKIMGIYPLLSTLCGRIKGLSCFSGKDVKLEKEYEFIKGRFLKFMDSYIREDIENLPKDGKNIIGFGRGLTPSMDDFISGIMISSFYLSNYLGHNGECCHKVNNAIVREIKGRTTLVSEEMLINASMGITNEDIRQFMISFLGDYPPKDFVSKMNKVINMGETSGSDTLCGIYIGASVYLNR